LSYLDLGILPIGGGAFFLPRLMGQGKALELMICIIHRQPDSAA